jgi:hypothetical protein
MVRNNTNSSTAIEQAQKSAISDIRVNGVGRGIPERLEEAQDILGLGQVRAAGVTE